MKQCSHPFINASGCINPELGHRRDNGTAYGRWQKRVLHYRRGNKAGGPRTSSCKGRRHWSGRQRGEGQSHNSNSGHNLQDARSGFSQQGSDGGYGKNTKSSAVTVHQSVPPSPASTTNAPIVRLSPSNNSNPNAGQLGTFRTGT